MRAPTLIFIAALLVAPSAAAQNLGFTVNRYQPTAAGEWSFAVDHPWYSSQRRLAAGLTLNYAHNPLVFGVSQQSGPGFSQTSIISHQFIAHVDLAASFLDRLLVTASLPVVLFEQGKSILGISPSGVAVGDPRIGVKGRIFGQAYTSSISVHASLDLWIPINSFSNPGPFPAQTGERGISFLPKIILGGLTRNIMWSFTGGFHYRRNQSIGGGLAPEFGNATGSALQFGAAIAYADLERRFAVGPEALFSTIVTGDNKFQRGSTSLEILLGAHYNIARLFQIGLAGGVGALREPGTPDVRFLLRFAYAPMAPPSDRDRDGVIDKNDLCPDEPMGLHPDPQRRGCALPDRDSDGIFDPDDLCPTEPAGDHPDLKKPGCPLRNIDRDKDGVNDIDDKCPDEPMGDYPDLDNKGCPLHDKDKDGIYDAQDKCPDEPMGDFPDPDQKGCPLRDKDGDGVFDAQDQCPDVPAGPKPDPARPGCPPADRDGDLVPDNVDACPDKPGAPSADPAKNGCPGLVEVKGGMIVILQQVFFAVDQDVILKKSFVVLNAVADVLSRLPQVKRVAVEGHTDDAGKAEYNRELSERRAKSVMKYLVARGIDQGRLEAHGYGPDRPIADNSKESGRALNRRVDFVIIDPKPAATTASPQVVETPSAPPDVPKPKKKGAKKPKR